MAFPSKKSETDSRISMKKPRYLVVAIAAVMITLAGCAAPGGAKPSPEQAAELESVKSAYAAGRYGEVIRDVARSNTLATAPTPVRVEALKLQAFSYCMNDYAQLCQDSFERILQMDPSFELSPSEAGHPQWGPVYARARAAR